MPLKNQVTSRKIGGRLVRLVTGKTKKGAGLFEQNGKSIQPEPIIKKAEPKISAEQQRINTLKDLAKEFTL